MVPPLFAKHRITRGSVEATRSKMAKDFEEEKKAHDDALVEPGSSILDSLVKLIQRFLGNKVKKGSMGSFSKFFFGGVAFFALAVAGYQNWRKGKKLARVLHKKDVAAKEHAILLADVEVKKNKDKYNDTVKSIHRTKKVLNHLNLQIKKHRNESDETAKQIESLKSWDDIDKYLSS